MSSGKFNSRKEETTGWNTHPTNGKTALRRQAEEGGCGEGGARGEEVVPEHSARDSMPGVPHRRDQFRGQAGCGEGGGVGGWGGAFGEIWPGPALQATFNSTPA